MTLDPKIIQWNTTEQDYPLNRCLHSFIEEQASNTPDSPALTYDGETLTYRELNCKANQLAHLLQSKGVRPETLVGICSFRSFEMVIGLLAIIKAGGAYIPFDPTYPLKRLEFMIGDSNVPIILTQRSCESIFQNSNSEIIYFEDIKEQLETYSGDNPKSDVSPDNLAYVIYTSGSTGNPKGAMNTHKAIVNRLFWMQDAFKLDSTDTLVQKTPFSFDVSVWEFFWGFMFGARLVVAKPDGHKDAGYLLDLISKENVTIIHFVPSMLRLFLEEADMERCKSLKNVVLSGEAVTIDLQKRYFSTLDIPLHNLYGPTEAAVDVSYWKCDPESQLDFVPIGKPISNTKLYILDKDCKSVPVGENGELHIGGVQVARGYLNRSELTAQKFIKDVFSDDPSDRLYKTGDLCRFSADGNIEYLGRIDFQVKIRGNRIELGEIETAITKDPSVKDCVVLAREDTPGEKRLVAYVVEDKVPFSLSKMRKKLAEELPDYMIPSIFVTMEAFPLSPSGKTDRLALPKPGRKRPELTNQFIEPRTDTEKKFVSVWCDILQLDSIGIEDNFFALGGDSLMGLRMCSKLQSDHSIKLPVVKLFQYPTISQLADKVDNEEEDDQFIDEINERATRQRIGRFQNNPDQDGIAVIGMAGRFPGAPDIDQLWENLCNEVESITHFSDEELGPGISQELIDNPDYVKARGIVEGADLFDAPFFGIGPLEARVMDPQQRIFLELCWAAMENSGYDSETYPGIIGVYAGVGDNHYYPNNVLAHPDLVETVGTAITGYGNEKDYIATRAAYSLNLTGPAVSANTGCSTSLLAVDHAFNALINYECDMALAGGVDIYVPQKSGFLYQKGGVFCKDGHCRPFDDDATGTMFNDGAGVVVLKRLPDAIADGDRIYAVIRGSAKNNDGANKASFLAPSVEGQAKAIAAAQALANVEPEDISYIEAHGTGTPLGDPIEVEALSKVFRYRTDKKQFCFLGSIKGNIGHPTIASGVAGFIKAALSLYYEKIPATLHYKKPNRRIDFQNSPFKVVDKLTPWPRTDQPRIAGISSFGFGGTNVHTILEEPPLPHDSGNSRPVQLLLLSAKNENTLEKAAEDLKNYLSHQNEIKLADVSYTLQKGRRYHAHRRYFVCKDIQDSINMLEKPDPMRSQTHICDTRDPKLIFVFPGQGTQYVNMGKNFYDTEPLFKSVIDQCCDILIPHLECDLRDFLFPEEDDYETASQSLQNTYYTQPAIFTIEYALARLLLSWGIKPSAMLGHSVGEFVCACLSGVFSLEDALRLVATRGRLIRDLPAGSMLSVRCNAEDLKSRLPDNIQLAASNSPLLSVVSGPDEAIDQFITVLEQDDIACKKLYTSHAFHSAMMDPVVDEFIAEVKKATLNVPKIPFVSTVTSQWMTDEDATNPTYWGRHLRMPVLFSNGIQILMEDIPGVFVEVGPRATSTTLIRQHGDKKHKILATPTMAESDKDNAEWIKLMSALGYLWLCGFSIDWHKIYENEHRHRLPLPTYPFEHKRYWVDYIPRNAPVDSYSTTSEIQTDLSDQEIAAKISPSMAVEEGALSNHIKSIIEEISGIASSNMDNTSTFLEMGMDSLLLAQIAFKVSKQFDVKVTFGQLIQDFPNINSLSDHINSYGKAGKTDAAPGSTVLKRHIIEKDDQGNYTIPITDGQRVIWKDCENRELSCSYNDLVVLNFKGKFDKEKFIQALNFVIDGHESLHAIFTENGSNLKIIQHFYPDYQFHDIVNVSKDKKRLFIEEALTKEQTTFFYLCKGPLIRVNLIQKESDQWIVLMTFHKSVCDGWSVDIILKELSTAYTKGTVERQDIAHFDFHDYVQFLNEQKTDKNHSALVEYWKNKLHSDNGTQNRITSSGVPKGSYETSFNELVLNEDIYLRIKDLSASSNYSIFLFMLTSLYFILRNALNKPTLTFGILVAGQLKVNEHDLIGNCSNLLLLKVESDPDDLFPDVLKKIQHLFIEAFDHMYDFESVKKDMIGSNQTIPEIDVIINNSAAFALEELPFDDLTFSYTFHPRVYEKNNVYIDIREDNRSLKILSHIKNDTDEELIIQDHLNNCEDFLKELLKHKIDRIESREMVLPQTNSISRYIIEINKSSSDNLIYFVVGVQIYHELAVRLADIAKCYGCYLPAEEALLVGNQRQEDWDVKTLASSYKEIISQHSKGRPVSIIGISFGGIIAYQLAKQLSQNGQKVNLLVMLDTLLPSGIRKDKLNWLILKTRETLKNGLRATYQKLLSKTKVRLSENRINREGIVENRNLVYGKTVSLFEKQNKMKYEGDTLLIRAIKSITQPGYLIDSSYGWDKYLSGRFMKEDVPGGHLDILKKPSVEKTAEKIKGILK